jgi:glucokinase
MKNFIGFDIGGTKCTVILGRTGAKETISVTDKLTFLTRDNPRPGMMIPQLQKGMEQLLMRHRLHVSKVAGIGISCGGPLDSRRGVIMSPPNLPGWDDVHIVDDLKSIYNLPVALQNDANACALAEWKFGAGRGYRNVIFLTFGTGMGAGLILNGSLYEGTNDNAGEVGHIGLENSGPLGYGKPGSFEGFCSGGGITRMARIKATEKLKRGETAGFFQNAGDVEEITAKSVAGAAMKGDPLAIEIFQTCGRYLGRGLSILIDILNPEVIILGSIYVRSAKLLQPALNDSLEREALVNARKVCTIVPSELEENLGDLAALSVAANIF